MIPIAHLSTGLAIFKMGSLTNVNTNDTFLMSSALLGSMAPDIDGLFGKKMKDHRYTIFHAPLFWILIYIIAYFAIKITGYTTFLIYLNVFMIGTLLHLVSDFISARTSGVWIFFPFSKKSHSLFKLHPEMGDTSIFPNLINNGYMIFWRFYLQNKVLITIELLVIFSSLAIYLFYPFGS